MLILGYCSCQNSYKGNQSKAATTSTLNYVLIHDGITCILVSLETDLVNYGCHDLSLWFVCPHPDCEYEYGAT